ncbi:MAG: FHA domain-containing protein [Deltaproteobacteria bacterium]|nr:FHA domain-containing protein [Deltaproteobacteria bacterium]
MKQAPVIVVQLVHLQGPMKGQIQEFTDPVISIGRSPECQIRFPADLTVVSRKHADIVRDGNRFKLTDHSTNGTFVNGKRVEEAFLKNGDVLIFSEGGPKVSFLTQMREQDQRPSPAPLAKAQEAMPARERPEIAGRESPPIAPVAPDEGDVLPQPVSAPLVFQYGPTLRSYKQLPVNIGKHPQCQFAIDHPGILDLHAQVFFSQNRYWVKDLTGRSLVQVNGEAIGLRPSPLSLQDLLKLGPQGPVFRFLGEGRLAEVEESSPESGDFPGQSRKDEAAGGAMEGKEDREKKSVFRRLFK